MLNPLLIHNYVPGLSGSMNIVYYIASVSNRAKTIVVHPLSSLVLLGTKDFEVTGHWVFCDA